MGSEKRRFTRYEIFQYANVEVEPAVAEDDDETANPSPCVEEYEEQEETTKEPGEKVIVVNVSVTGLQFRSREPFPLNAPITIHLLAEGRPLEVPAVIRYKRKISLSSDVHAYGVEFCLDNDADKKRNVCDYILNARADFRKRGHRI